VTRLVEARSLTKTYASRAQSGSPVEALRGVDLELDRGDYLAVMGASGSGKSTLMHILGCLDRPTSGSYKLQGREVAELSDRELARVRNDRIGFVFQTFNLVPELDVLENAALPFLYGALARNDALARASHAIERVGLAGRRTHRPAELSGGEMQRVAIARALAIEPALILADEPTGNLDSATGREILELFDTLHADGATVVIVTHDAVVAERAQRVQTMRDGAFVEEAVA